MMSRRLLAPLAVALLAASAVAQEPPPPGAADLINGLLAGLMGFKEVSPAGAAGRRGRRGRRSLQGAVPLDFITPVELRPYLKEVLDDEYPHHRADADARLLIALDLLPPGTSLRDLRARLLEDNVAGFYDERPGRKKLFAVSEDRALTPSNQIVLATSCATRCRTSTSTCTAASRSRWGISTTAGWPSWRSSKATPRW